MLFLLPDCRCGKSKLESNRRENPVRVRELSTTNVLIRTKLENIVKYDNWIMKQEENPS